MVVIISQRRSKVVQNNPTIVVIVLFWLKIFSAAAEATPTKPIPMYFNCLALQLVVNSGPSALQYFQT